MQLHRSNFIQTFEDFLPLEVLEKCSRLCDKAAEHATVGSQCVVVPEIRNAKLCNRGKLYEEELEDLSSIASFFWDNTKEYLKKINLSCVFEFETFEEDYKLEVLNFLKYEPGGFYKEHTDETFIRTVSPDFARQISYVLFVNDSYSGGSLVFPTLDIKVEPKANTLVMFPSNWLFVHKVSSVFQGTRKTVVGWGGTMV